MRALSRRLVFAFSIAASGVALNLPADAQLADGRLAFDAHPGLEFVQFGDFWGDRRSPYRNNFYDPFWGDRRSSIQIIPMIRTIHFIGGRNRRSTNSIKPPAPRKVETPPAETVLVIGDSFGEWLAYGLELVFAETPQIGIVRKIKPDLGLVRDDARLDAPEWTQAIKDLLPAATEKANAIVVMLGVNDRSPLRERAPATKASTTPPDSEHPPSATIGPSAPAAGRNLRVSYRQMGRALCQAHRRHDRGAQDEGRTDYMGGITGDPWRQIDKRYELSRRALSRASR